MTDKEVIKALELCANLEECKDCPMANMQKYDTDTCEHQIMLYALDLINRQKAEIERLNKEVDRLSQCVMYHDGYIVDAIKEFAERLKEKSKQGKGYLGNVYHSVNVAEIDNLLKEMVGDNNE